MIVVEDASSSNINLISLQNLRIYRELWIMNRAPSPVYLGIWKVSNVMIIVGRFRGRDGVSIPKR